MSTTKEKAILTRIDISGYRSCRDTKFVPNQNLSALIGINGAGKTNILNAICLLKTEEHYRTEKALSVGTKIVAWFTVAGKHIGLKLDLQISPDARGRDEVLSCKETWNFSDYNGGKRWIHLRETEMWPSVRRTSWSRGTYATRFAPHNIVASELVYIKRVLKRPTKHQKAKIVAANPTIIAAIHAVNEFRGGIKYYSASQFTNPSHCPNNFEIDNQGSPESTYSWSTHTHFLYDLYSLRQKNPDLYNEYISIVSRQKLGLINRLNWKRVPLSSSTVEVKSSGKIQKVRQSKTLIIPKIQVGSSHLTFNQLSEGTFKTLALIFYIMTSQDSCLLIEEPEVCVHHGLLRHIISIINAYASSKQIVFSTHSDLVLDGMPQSDVFVVEMEKSQTRVAALSKWLGKREKEALKAYLQEAGTLGEYWRSGGFVK